MCVDSLVKQIQFYVILDAVIVVLLLTFIEALYGHIWLWIMEYCVSSKYIEEMHAAWRIAMRKIWKLHPHTHNILICNIRTNFIHSLEIKTYMFPL